MKIALIHCPLWGTFDPPMGAAQISSFLKNKGYEVRVFDLNIKLYLNQSEGRKNIWAWEDTDFWCSPEHVGKFFLQSRENSGLIDHCIEQISKDNIRIVGFSVNLASRLFSLEFARKLKSCDKGITIVFGGPIFLREGFITEILREKCVDIVIPGEGLLALSGLVEALRSGKSIDSCRGLVFRQGASIVKTSPAPLVNLGRLPFLDFTDLPLDHYDNGTHISLMTSRGCVRRCFFCSDAPCRPDYRVMSGKRIFDEVKFHKDRYGHRLGHIDFMDLVFNGNMNSLRDFCDLMIEADLDMNWTANMYIRQGVTSQVIKKMKAAKCAHIILGIESGSERVLALMNKHYCMADADRIIRQMHDEGICVTANFMFGFPGETEDDFQLTLDFLRRNARYMGVYPSRTYCALEEFSALEKHPEKFGIKPNPCGHLFWESIDGKNTYPVRMDRCRRFCNLVSDLGAQVTGGVQTTVQLDEWFNLGCYYESKADYANAAMNFLNYFRENPADPRIGGKLLAVGNKFPHARLDKNTQNDLEKAIKDIADPKDLKEKDIRSDRPLSTAFVKTQIDKLDNEINRLHKRQLSQSTASAIGAQFCKIKCWHRTVSENHQDGLSGCFSRLEQKIASLPLQQANRSLNLREFNERAGWMDSFPANVCLPLADGKDDFRYIFEPASEIRSRFNLEKLMANADPQIDFLLSIAERCIFKGGGNISLGRDGGKILDYFKNNYPRLEKEIFTKGTNFSNEVIDGLAASSSNCVINFSLNASNRDLHRKISNKDNFDEIRSNLEYLCKKREKSRNIAVNIIYTATVLNIEDLSGVINLAAGVRVDKVIVDYNCIYAPEQENISCFHKQDATNKVFDFVHKQAKSLDLTVQLPPKFNQNSYPEPVVCRKPWSQMVLDSDGKIFPCDYFWIQGARFDKSATLPQIWNARERQAIRRCFQKAGHSECSMFCYHVNPKLVNSLRSHIFNAKYFGFEKSHSFGEDLSLDLDSNELEKVTDIAECHIQLFQDFVSSERIINQICGKVKNPSRLWRLLAESHVTKAECAGSKLKKLRFLKLAQKEVETSLSAYNRDPYTHAEAARIYSALGCSKQAKKAITNALSLFSQNEKVGGIRNKLPHMYPDENAQNNLEKAIKGIADPKYLKEKESRSDRSLSAAFVKGQIDELSDETERFKTQEINQSDAGIINTQLSEIRGWHNALSEDQKHALSGHFSELKQKVGALPLRRMNQALNKEEFKAGAVWLHSFPVNICLPIHEDKDDFQYIFEPQIKMQRGFNLEKLMDNPRPQIDCFLPHATRCVLKGGKNISLGREGGKILNYLENEYPGLEKEIFTNGTNFSDEVINRIASSRSNYIINFCLHASCRDLHRKISNKNNFDEILANLENLCKKRRKSKNIAVNVIYTATALNIKDLPGVINLAAAVRVDKVIVDYNCIHTPRQKNISCFYSQDATNKILDFVHNRAKSLDLTVQLPPKFNQDSYPEPVVCGKPWNQLVLDSDGKILPCEHYRILGARFDKSATLQQIWNGMEYKAIRHCFEVVNRSECSMFCYHVNPKLVNSLRSHIFNAKYFGFEKRPGFGEDLSLDFDSNEMEKVIDIAEYYIQSLQDFVSSERIIKDIFKKLKYPSRPLRLLAETHRKKAECVSSTFEKKRLLKLAQEEIENSLAVWHLDPFTHSEAARIYSALGRRKQAKDALWEALSLSPQDKAITLLKQKLFPN